MKKLGMLIAGWLLAMGLAFAQVNINTASQEELDGLKGIGPTKAKAIVDYRKKNGPFRTVDDLEKVPGIGPATLQDLRGEVSISGAARSPTPAAAARPAGPAMPGKIAPEARPAAPAAPMLKPAAPAPAQPMAKPAAPAKPAIPARPAQPSAVN